MQPVISQSAHTPRPERPSATLYALKPCVQSLIRPLAKWLAALGVRPNQLTLAAAAVSALVGTTVALNVDDRRLFLLIPLWYPLRMISNALDGVMARELGMRTRLGTYLNELGDTLSDAALIAPFAWVSLWPAAGIAAVILLSALSEHTGAIGPMLGVSRRYDGPMGKSDRALVFSGLGLWVGSGLTLPGWMSCIVPVVLGLLIVTVINRVRGGLEEAHRANRRREIS